MAEYTLWNALEKAKKYKWVELSHSLNNDSPYWSGMPENSVELSKTIFDWGNPMLECLIKSFRFPGQFGTHIDFPGHFAKGKPYLSACCDRHYRPGEKGRALCGDAGGYPGL